MLAAHSTNKNLIPGDPLMVDDNTEDDLDLSTLPDDELVEQMHDDLYDGLREEIVEGTNILLERGWSATKVLDEALVEGMRIVGIDFRDGILFVPEVLMSANAMKGGMEILRPLLAETGAKPIGKMVIGTVKGDIHDIGKNLVGMMMEGAGFEVVDLGINNPVESYLEAIEKEGSLVPPSGAMVGVYSAVDSSRGVWKAPANVSVSSVIRPSVAIDDADQQDLNIDTNGGKSVNAIRSFTGRGTLIWGARTLAGNNNEWRYVPVRRFFNMVEESIKKSTAWAVFEPNDANTWTKVKGMIDNYLLQKWREGALQGAVPEDAFFVKIGLGLTMTAQDILEGRMIVEIGMAVVRPAEFIILKFSHKLAES